MTRLVTLGLLCGLLVGAGACLIKDTAETWYIDANGGVRWVVTERDVRSDAGVAADREQEESEYWLAVQQHRHPVALGLQELGGDKVQTTVLRAESPYTVQTDARFTGLDELGRRIIAAAGATGTSIITRDGPTWDWKLVVHDPSALASIAEPSQNVDALLGELDSLHVVLIAGHFESAEGFTLSSDRRIATFVAKDDAHGKAEEPVVTLHLVWK